MTIRNIRIYTENHFSEKGISKNTQEYGSCYSLTGLGIQSNVVILSLCDHHRNLSANYVANCPAFMSFSVRQLRLYCPVSRSNCTFRIGETSICSGIRPTGSRFARSAMIKNRKWLVTTSYHFRKAWHASNACFR